MSDLDDDLAEDARTIAAKREATRVYFIEAPDVGVVKIGYSYRIADRFTDLNNSSPTPLVLLGHVKGTKVDEQRLHERFATVRVRGEWFSRAAVMPFVQALLNKSAADVADLFDSLRHNPNLSVSLSDRSDSAHADQKGTESQLVTEGY